MSQYLKRAGLVLGAGGIYVGAVFLTFQYVNLNNEEIDQATLEARRLGKTFVKDPKRTDTFQQIAYAYDDEIGKDELVMGINLLRRALLYFHAKGRTLEVGAGTGRNLGYYPLGADEKSVSKIILTDTADRMLLRAKKKVEKMSKSDQDRYEIAVADAANLEQYKDDAFDTVVDTFGLCSFDDPVAVLKELQRVCHPKGKILLLEHGRTKSYEGLNKYLDKNAERHAKNWGCVWNRDIDQILNDAGLQIDTLQTWHFGTTYYVVCRPKHHSDALQKQTTTTNLVRTTAATNHQSHPLTTALSSWIFNESFFGLLLFYIPTWKCDHGHHCNCSHHKHHHPQQQQNLNKQ